jgi:hypothetical protein
MPENFLGIGITKMAGMEIKVPVVPMMPVVI